MTTSMTTTIEDWVVYLLGGVAILCALILIILPIAVSISNVWENPKEEIPYDSFEEVQTKINTLNKEIQFLYQMHSIAARERNRLLDGLISVYDTIKNVGFVGDPKRDPPKLKMWRCVDPQEPVGVVR